MASANFNSTPRNDTGGFRDKSNPDPILTAKQYPTHLPLWFIFGQKGPLTRTLADSNIREQLYGSLTFDDTSKFYNHQTKFSDTVASKGNQCIYQRLVSPEAKASAMRLWIDWIAFQVPLYERGTDGKYVLDGTGNPKPTGSFATGYRIKFVKTAIGEGALGGAFGQAAQMDGDQVVAGVQSKRYAFMDLPVTFMGAYGDDLGFRMWAPVAGSRVTPDAELLEVNKSYPYVFACLDRSSDSVQNINTVSGTQEMTAVLRQDQVKKSVKQPISFDPRFYDMYNDRERTGMAPLYGPFDQVHVYQDNLEELLKMFYDAEEQYFDGFSDFDGSGYTDDDVGEIHRFNILSGKSSKNVPYHSFIVDRTSPNAQAMSDISAVWAEGGSDGKTDLDTFNRLVQAEMTKYGDLSYETTEDRLGNPESIFYDTGFDTDCKMALANFIAVRKDTFLVWVLQDAQEARPLAADEESSMAIALYTRGQMMPESTEYGTSASRFMIVAGDGRLVSSTYRKRLPLSLEIASKSAEYMGAANGLWKSEFAFSNGDRANVTMFRDVNVTWRPITSRARDWSNGMVYVQKKDMDMLFFPGLRTGYPTATSIFTSFFTNLIFVDLQKVADRVWANFTGNDKYTNEQFKKYVEQEFNRQIEGKYDSRVTINAYVTFSAVDEFNGYSWTLNGDVGAENMKTVQTTILTGYRRENMPATT